MASSEDTQLTLYTYFRSSCSWRVRIALAHKQLKYTAKYVNLIKNGTGEQKGPEYSDINPMQQVPTLVVDNVHRIADSMAIMEYLEEAFPESPKLLPDDTVQRAICRSMCHLIASGIQPVQNLSVLKRLAPDGREDAVEARAEWARYYIDRGFTALDRLLERTSGTYCLGDRVTLADVCLVPQVFNANRYKVDMSKFANISRIHGALETLDAFRSALPARQPDCPEDLRDTS